MVEDVATSEILEGLGDELAVSAKILNLLFDDGIGHATKFVDGWAIEKLFGWETGDYLFDELVFLLLLLDWSLCIILNYLL